MPSASLLVIVAAGLAAIMAGAWAVQRATGNAGWVDVVWSLSTGGAGIVLALAPSGGGFDLRPGPRQIAVAILAALWSLRLGFHLARRVAHGPEDARYALLRSRWGERFQLRIFGFLELQAVAALLLALTIALAAHNPVERMRPLDYAAAAMLIVALIGAAVADQQLHRFRADHPHDPSQPQPKVCDVGLWGLSRHPNYFFEWLGWAAYPLIAIAPGDGYGWGWAALLGPAFMYGLLVHASGIPPLEEHMLRTRGAAFRAYQRRTNAFWPGRRRPALGSDGDSGETFPSARCG
jgi:steroid 5-alpha reductase family enzyme